MAKDLCCKCVAHRHGWGCPVSTAHRSQSVCRLLFPALESRRGPGIPPRRRRVSCRHGNLKRRWWWCPRLSSTSPARCRAQPQSAAASRFAKRRRLAEWRRGSPLHPLWVSRSLCCRDKEGKVKTEKQTLEAFVNISHKPDNFLLSSHPSKLQIGISPSAVRMSKSFVNWSDKTPNDW